MSALYVLALLTAAALLLAPFALLARRLLPELPGGMLALLLAAASLLYFLEHQLWLSPTLLWLGWLGLAGAALACNQDLLRSSPQAWLARVGGPATLLVLALAVVYPLLWRYLFPSLYASSEKLTNLLFLQNFLYAEGLPAVDRWLPPYKFDFYYPLQYYLMSLPGRMLGLPPGILYQSGFVLFVAATLFACWRLGLRLLGRPARAALLTLVLGLGGTGAALISIPWHYQTMDGPDENPAFIGLTAEARFNGGVFYKIFGNEGGASLQEQPLEYFAYQIFLGDYHPTLSGFFLCLLLLALLYHLSRAPLAADRGPLLLLGALPMLMLASNSWLFPHVVLVAGLWLPWRWWVERDTAAALQRLGWMAGGALASLLLFLPQLQGLSARSFNIGMQLVPMDYRGTPWPYVLQFWPLFALCALALARERLRGTGGYIALLTLLLLGFNGLLYVNDLSVNEYERTNSALKWWSWTWAFGSIGTLAALLAAPARGSRWPAMAISLLLLVPAVPLFDQLLRHHGDDVGRIHGDHIYLRDHAAKSIILYLREQPQGIVVENVKASAYDDSGAIALMGHKPVYLGWPDHQYTWRGGFGEVAARREAINALYAGTLPDPARWARARDIAFIVWSARECRESGGLAGFQTVNSTLESGYEFRRTDFWGDCPVGVWQPLSR